MAAKAHPRVTETGSSGCTTYGYGIRLDTHMAGEGVPTSRFCKPPAHARVIVIGLGLNPVYIPADLDFDRLA